LEIEVVNAWLNRLVGDDRPGTAKTWTSATTRTWKGPLQPAGLLGPVTLTVPALLSATQSGVPQPLHP
jgi:hypothetical protein